LQDVQPSRRLYLSVICKRYKSVLYLYFVTNIKQIVLRNKCN